MSKNRNKTKPDSTPNTRSSSSRGMIVAIILAVVAIGVAMFALNRKPSAPEQSNATQTTTTPAAATAQPPAAQTPLPSMEVNQAVMVTVELDFGGPPPSIAEALKSIERRHQPDAGTGRVFAILDAYGEPTPDGKKLHMSMHVSSEKPGVGSLIFGRTGETLWSSRIVPTTNAPSTFAGTALTILLDDGSGKLLTVDGSKGPSSILEADIKELGRPIHEVWPDGTEREITFIYSACGCPVKVMCRRVGDRTMRTKEMPVIFPDDPTVVTLITQLMRW